MPKMKVTCDVCVCVLRSRWTTLGSPWLGLDVLEYDVFGEFFCKRGFKPAEVQLSSQEENHRAPWDGRAGVRMREMGVFEGGLDYLCKVEIERCACVTVYLEEPTEKKVGDVCLFCVLVPTTASVLSSSPRKKRVHQRKAVRCGAHVRCDLCLCAQGPADTRSFVVAESPCTPSSWKLEEKGSADVVLAWFIVKV